MAKIVPKGYADIGAYNEMDDYTQIMDFLRNISSTIEDKIKIYETEQIISLKVINNIREKADDPSDLIFAQRKLDSLPNYTDNEAINITRESIQRDIAQTKDDFTTIQSLGNEIADFMTTPLDIKYEDGNVIASKLFSDMTALEAQQYYRSITGTNELREGAIDDLVNKANKFRQFNQALGVQFGLDSRGQLKKSPKFKFTSSAGGEMNMSEFTTRFKRYGDSIEILIDAGFGAEGILNYEEAELVKRGDIGAYNKIKAQRKEEYIKYGQNTRRQIDKVNSTMQSIIKSGDVLSEAMMGSLEDVMKMTDSSGQPFAAELFQNDFASSAPSSLDTMFDEYKEDMSRMSKPQLQTYLQSVKDKLVKSDKRNIDGAIAWGYGGYFGAQPKDLSKFQDLIETAKKSSL